MSSPGAVITPVVDSIFSAKPLYYLTNDGMLPLPLLQIFEPLLYPSTTEVPSGSSAVQKM